MVNLTEAEILADPELLREAWIEAVQEQVTSCLDHATMYDCWGREDRTIDEWPISARKEEEMAAMLCRAIKAIEAIDE